MLLLRLLKPMVLMGLCLFSLDVLAESTVLTLQAVTEIAIQDNPNLAQMQARAKAMAAIPSQEGTLPDPQIKFNAMSLPVNGLSITQEDMTQLGVGISQGIPFPGKLALREQAALFEAQAELLNVEEMRFRLVSEVRRTWWMIFYLDRTLALVNNTHTLLQQFVQITRKKYEVGMGLQQDVLLAQLELSKLLDQQLMLNNSRRNSAASLNALLNQSPDKELTLPDTIGLSIPKVKAEKSLYQIAENSRALLESNRQTIHAAKSRLELAKKDYLPDFMIEVGYGARANSPTGMKRADLLNLGVSMNVPIFTATKQAKAVDQRTSELMRDQYALQDEWNNVRSQITQNYADYQRAKEQFALYDTSILPQARQTVASMLAGYQVNKVDFLNLVRSQITLFEYEIQYWKSFTEANQAVAQLSATVGGDDIYE